MLLLWSGKGVKPASGRGRSIRQAIAETIVRRYAKLRPRFATTCDAPFVSRVLLPNNSAVTAATGLPYPQKDTARASACLVACRMLHKARPSNGLRAASMLSTALFKQADNRRRSES